MEISSVSGLKRALAGNATLAARATARLPATSCEGAAPPNEGLGRESTACYRVVSNKAAGGSMLYTPGQVRQIVGITQETLRHWRSVFGSLSGVRGFRPNQVLGLAVVRWMVDELGLSVGTLKGAERKMFEICGSHQWERLSRGYLVVKPVENTARFVPSITDDDIGKGAVVVPFAPIIAAIRGTLFQVAPEEDQQSFPFRPVAVHEKGSKRAVGRQS